MLYGLYSLPDIRADNCGEAILRPGWSHPERRLPSSVLILGRRGRAGILDGGELLETRPGRALLLLAGRSHRGAAPIRASAAYSWIHFTAAPRGLAILDEPDALAVLGDPAIARHRLRESALIPQSIDLPEPGPVSRFFRDLLFEQESPSYSPLKFQLIFRCLLIALTEGALSSRGPARRESELSRLAYAVRAEISERLCDPELSVKSIAAALDLNPDYLGRRFRQAAGVSIGTFILKERIDLAEARLQSTRDPVKEIAAACGFASTRHFLRRFKAERGLTPTEQRLHYDARHINNQ
jgi:AraC-like DNA-binding protein